MRRVFQSRMVFCLDIGYWRVFGYWISTRQRCAETRARDNFVGPILRDLVNGVAGFTKKHLGLVRILTPRRVFLRSLYSIMTWWSIAKSINSLILLVWVRSKMRDFSVEIVPRVPACRQKRSAHPHNDLPRALS